MAKKTWFDVGFEEATSGKEYRAPESYHARMAYMMGWEAGKAGDRKADPFLGKGK